MKLFLGMVALVISKMLMMKMDINDGRSDEMARVLLFLVVTIKLDFFLFIFDSFVSLKIYFKFNF
jgi:uncharacterized membrane protein YczE